MKTSQVPPPLMKPVDLKTGQNHDDPRITPEMRKAAEGMESVFTGEMLKAMRTTVEPSEFSLHNSASDIYQGMLDQEYSDIAARQNSLGLSNQILDYWLRSDSKEQYNKIRNSQLPAHTAGRTGGTHEGQSE